jgi:hypothetical protein
MPGICVGGAQLGVAVRAIKPRGAALAIATWHRPSDEGDTSETLRGREGHGVALVTGSHAVRSCGYPGRTSGRPGKPRVSLVR